MPFLAARAFAHSLKLKSSAEWRAYCDGRTPHPNKLPPTLSAYPFQYYRRRGWVSWADWLGSEGRQKAYRTFEEARIFARELKLMEADEWFDFVRNRSSMKVSLPKDIPKAPHVAYKNKGWTSWTDFLGTELHRYRDFDSALAYAQSLNLAGKEEWLRLMSRDVLPKDIPRAPHNYYGKRGQWRGWRIWLQSRDYIPYDEARTFARSLKLKSRLEWKAYCEGKLEHLPMRPKNIPTNPAYVYQDQNKWGGWSDWLGVSGKAAERTSHFRKLLASSRAATKTEKK